MTILPKKKAQKDKNECESRDPPRSPPGETRLGHSSRRQANSSHTNWSASSSRDDPNIDPGGRYEPVHNHELSQTHTKKRHRSSPHRTSRKLRHTSHQSHSERQSTRQDRQNSRQLWVDPTPGTSHANLSPLTHATHKSYCTSQDRCVSVNDAEEGGYNSEDEYSSSQPVIPKLNGKQLNTDELERCFEATLKEKRGFLIKPMGEDGACMFRAVADQVFGDQEMHSIVRRNCVEYMAKNADFFSQYVTEDFNSYLNRKRIESSHGNHIEMQALCELYNRPIEVYQYSIDPINTFHGAYKMGNDPIRLSYHSNHYNSVVDPMKATIGVGLGLPGYQPGAADRNLLSDAQQVSEKVHIEQTMLEDKMRETDWEVTQESIEEQVARESYLQFLREQEKRAKSHEPSASASAACSSSSMATPCFWPPDPPPPPPPPSSTSQQRNSPQPPPPPSQQQQRSPPAEDDGRLLGGDRCHSMVVGSGSSPQHSPSPSHQALLYLPTSEHHSLMQVAPFSPKPSTSSSEEPSGGATAPAFCETDSMSNTFNPALYGLSDWDEDEIMASVIARSQQEYMDSLRQHSSANSSPSSTPAHTMMDS